MIHMPAAQTATPMAAPMAPGCSFSLSFHHFVSSVSAMVRVRESRGAAGRAGSEDARGVLTAEEVDAKRPREEILLIERADDFEAHLSTAPRRPRLGRRDELFRLRVCRNETKAPEKEEPRETRLFTPCRTMEPSGAYQTTVDTDTFHPNEPDIADTAREAVGGEGLPAPDANGDPSVPKLDVNGGAVTMDAMGPVVVNDDGSLSRITNWSKLTEREREVTQRRIAKRNAERLERLRAKENERESV